MLKALNKKLFLLPLLIIVIAAIAFLYLQQQKNSEEINISDSQTQSNQEENFRASFAIYTNGTFRVFTDPRYHNRSEKVFIQSPDVNVVNVKSTNITWGDFFTTLPMKLEKNCITTGTGQTFCTDQTYILQFFVNGDSDPNALDKEIRPGDKLLVTYEKPNSTNIENQLNSIPEAN